MSKISRAALITVFASASTALAFGATAVPEGYVITPFGYYHPSCVQRVAQGDVLRSKELAVQHPDGSMDSMHACAYPHYTAKGEAVAAGTQETAETKEPKISGWVEDISTTTQTSFGAVETTWKVPPQPTSNDGQTLFFFPGLEQDGGADVTILQPVLGWNSNYHNAWEIASWNCCVQGTIYESIPLLVNVGDTIFGAVFNTCSPGTLECTSWDVLTQDVTAESFTRLTGQSNYNQTFNWAFTNVMEVYNVRRCSDYPPNHKLETEIALFDDQFREIKDQPYYGSISKVSPRCDYGTFGKDHKQKLTF